MTVAIAIALYNGEKFITEQLDSLFYQSRSADEVILCDDGSSDNTYLIVENYICNHNLVGKWKLYRNSHNMGYVKNFYKAISLCDSDIIFLCDQDDIWAKDKISKMAAIMQTHININLLSCKYGIIDAYGKKQYSIVENNGKNDDSLKSVSVKNIMQAFHWPGMVMCMRQKFFDEIYEQIKECNSAHDLVFCLCAADSNTFYEYGYVGAYHRRHTNNTAREEHRIKKLLNREKKLFEIEYNLNQLNELQQSDILFSDSAKKILSKREEFLKNRMEVLQKKCIKGVIRLYLKNKKEHFRIKSLLCDIALVFLK